MYSEGFTDKAYDGDDREVEIWTRGVYENLSKLSLFKNQISASLRATGGNLTSGERHQAIRGSQSSQWLDFASDRPRELRKQQLGAI